MPIYPRGDSFMVSVGSGPDRIRETHPTRAQAEAREAVLLAAKKAARSGLYVPPEGPGAVPLGDPSKTLQDAFDRVLRESWAGSKGERTTVLNARQMLALIGPNTPVVEITTATIDSALDELADNGNTGATINRKVAVLNVMLKAARDRGWIKHIPHIKRQRESAHRIYWYTEAEQAEMVTACQKLGMHTLADFITFAIMTGFRRSELLKLRLEDCEGGSIRLHNGDTKSDLGRTQQTTKTTEAILTRARAAGHGRVFAGLTESTLRAQWDALRDYLGKSGDPKYIVHALRHTTATRLAIKGATAPQIMTYMGHSAIQTSMRYIHLTHGHMAGVAALLEAPEKPVGGHLRVVGTGT